MPQVRTTSTFASFDATGMALAESVIDAWTKSGNGCLGFVTRELCLLRLGFESMNVRFGVAVFASRFRMFLRQS